jgi:hypothetical protein
MRSRLSKDALATRTTVITLLLIGFSLASTSPALALKPEPGFGGSWSCDCDTGSGTCTFNSGPSGGYCSKEKGDTCTGICEYKSNTKGATPPPLAHEGTQGGGTPGGVKPERPPVGGPGASQH